MTSPFFGLDIATRSLRAQQTLVDIANQNIANANTPGYSRQEAVLTQSPGSAPNSHELGTIGYGPRRDELADDLAGQVRGWDAAGRPGTQGLRIDAYPAAVPEDELPDRPRIRKRHNWFVLSRTTDPR